MKINQAIKIGSSILKTKITKCPLPLKVTYYTTYKCNLSCMFCKRKDVSMKELSSGEAMKMMEKFQRMGTLLWNFNGGESLLRSDIEELINYSKKLGFYTTLLTNGTLIKQKVKAIENIDHADISIDGNEAVHDSIRGAGAYHKALEGLGILKDLKISTTIMSVINKDNIVDLDHVIHIAEKYKCSIKFQPVAVHPEDASEEAKNYYPNKKDFINTIDWLIEQKKKGRPVFSSIYYLEKIKNNWPDKQNEISCYAGRLHCNITPEGKISPCCAKLSKIEAASLQELPDMSKCQECFYSGPLELNLLFGLLPDAVIEQLKNTFLKRYL